MGFYEILDQVVDLLRCRGWVTYRALKREFQVDDAFLEDLKAEIITAQRLALDEQGAVLVWVGEAGTPPAPQEDASSPQGKPRGDELAPRELRQCGETIDAAPPGVARTVVRDQICPHERLRARAAVAAVAHGVPRPALKALLAHASLA